MGNILTLPNESEDKKIMLPGNRILRDADDFFVGREYYSVPVRGSLNKLLTQSSLSDNIAKSVSAANDSIAKEVFGPFSKFVFVLLTLAFFIFSQGAHAEARLKDIADFQGVRDNLLIGYGLVVGLPGSGDKLKNNEFTSQSLIAFLERQGVNTRGIELKSKNVAAVTVTATLPPFSRLGNKINVTVSALGDARSLMGGTLLATSLYGADNQVYVVAQGAISIAGFEAQAGATTVSKGVATNGYISNGGIVEKEIAFSLNSMSSVNIGLRNPDIMTAKHIAEAINKHLGVEAAEVFDSGTVHLRVPIDFKDRTSQLLAEIEPLPVKTDQVAKVVVDEASGTIVMGENVRIDTVAVAQGNLIIKVEENTQVSQPGVLAPAGAATVVTENPTVTVEEGHSKLAVMQHGTSLRELVAGLNALGVGPRDLITILQTIKSAGALEAEVVAK